MSSEGSAKAGEYVKNVTGSTGVEGAKNWGSTGIGKDLVGSSGMLSSKFSFPNGCTQFVSSPVPSGRAI